LRATNNDEGTTIELNTVVFDSLPDDQILVERDLVQSVGDPESAANREDG
jgi:hypothetical protein